MRWSAIGFTLWTWDERGAYHLMQEMPTLDLRNRSKGEKGKRG